MGVSVLGFKLNHVVKVATDEADMCHLNCSSICMQWLSTCSVLNHQMLTYRQIDLPEQFRWNRNRNTVRFHPKQSKWKCPLEIIGHFVQGLVTTWLTRLMHRFPTLPLPMQNCNTLKACNSLQQWANFRFVIWPASDPIILATRIPCMAISGTYDR